MNNHSSAISIMITNSNYNTIIIITTIIMILASNNNTHSSASRHSQEDEWKSASRTAMAATMQESGQNITHQKSQASNFIEQCH